MPELLNVDSAQGLRAALECVLAKLAVTILHADTNGGTDNN